MKKDRNYWKERLSLIQAYVDGYEIVASGGYSSEQWESISFCEDVHNYKIIPKPHVHQELIDAFEKGAKIQYWVESDNKWFDISNPTWVTYIKYRIKPDPYQVFRDALKAGKRIQIKSGDIWYDGNSSYWSFSEPPEYYRIKPERKLVPFDFSDRNQIIARTIKRMDNGALYVITKASEDSVGSGTLRMTYETLLTYYTFTDDSPCGKWVEE